MLEQIISTDQTVTSFLAGILPHNSIFDTIFTFFSLNGISVYIWLFLLVGIIIWQRKYYRELVVFFILSFTITWIFVSVVVKNIVQRDRPWVVQNVDTTICPKDFSFPSGHASSAFAGATVFAYYDKKRRWLYYPLAILVAYSRIYLYCHYFLDVSIGALIGYLISRATLALLPYRKKLLPHKEFTV
ncbi:phosphatase PAP2 family protein [soil metagenome]